MSSASSSDWMISSSSSFLSSEDAADGAPTLKVGTEELESREGIEYMECMDGSRRGCREFAKAVGGSQTSGHELRKTTSLLIAVVVVAGSASSSSSSSSSASRGLHVLVDRKLGHRLGLEGSRMGIMGDVMLECKNNRSSMFNNVLALRSRDGICACNNSRSDSSLDVVVDVEKDEKVALE